MLSRENRAVLCCTVLGDGGGAAEQSNNSSGTPRPVPFHHHRPAPATHARARLSLPLSDMLLFQSPCDVSVGAKSGSERGEGGTRSSVSGLPHEGPGGTASQAGSRLAGGTPSLSSSPSLHPACCLPSTHLWAEVSTGPGNIPVAETQRPPRWRSQ